MSAEQPLHRRAARGMAWAYGSYVGGRFLVLVATAILARLLTPEEFGVVALALAFTNFLDMVKDLGIAEALVVVRDKVEEKAETAWVAMQVGGVLLLAFTAGLGQIAADFYDEPKLAAMLPVLGLTFVLRSLGSTHYALAQKRLDFRTRTAAELSDVVVRGVAGIALALAGAGAWSLVLGYVLGTAAMTATLWRLVPWRPRLKPQRAHLRELLGFGGALTGVSLAAAFLGNADRMIIPSALGATALGLYSLAARLPEMLILNLSLVAGQVLFPAFAAVDPAALRDALLTSLRYTAMVAFPLAAFLAVLAEPLIVAAFGDQWRGGAETMRVFSIAAMASPITFVCGTVLKARGRAALLLRVSILHVLLVVPAAIVVVDDGIVAVAACYAIAGGIVLLLQLGLAMRLTGARPGPVLTALWPPALGGVTVAAAVWAVDRAVDGPWATVGAAALAALAVYAVVLWLFARDSVRRLARAFLPMAAPEGA